MSFWEKLFGKTKQAQRRHDCGSKDTATRTTIGCPFCGGSKLQNDRSAQHLYPVWNCTCGAFGSGAWLPDLDEVADQLLEMLGIDTRVSEPCVSTDHPAISMQRYDVNQTERDLAEVLKRHGFEFRITPGDNPNERMFWVRRDDDKV